SSSDGITMDDSLKGTADANSAIQIYNGATLLASTTADGSGNWSVAKAALGLADGSYTLTVNETDIAGNTGTTSVGFTLDTAPDVVTAKLSNDTGASSSDGITMDDSLKGTADANSAIQIYNGATLLASTTADGSGNWSVAKAALGLADGSYTLTVNETDIAGNTGTTSVGFTLDTAPDVVTAKLSNDTGASSSDGITMDDSLKGTADANSAIQIYNGATLLASTTADGSGNWSVAKAALGLADGSYTLTVNETDIAGNTGTTSVGFTLDTAPDVVTAKLSNDTGASSSDGITMDDSLKGTADANSAIQIYNGATLLASTTADGSGNWSVAKAALGLADGSYTLTVNETDIAGNTGTTSVGFTLDTAPDVVTAKLSNDTGASSSDGITMDDSLKGTADANSAIQIYNGATLLASTTADGSGNWSVAKAALGLADGSYTLTVNETDIAGNTGTTSVGFTLDTAPDVVTAKLSNDTGASSSDGITMDDSLKGTADANSAIQIYNGATLLASTTADGSGNWSVAKAALGLADGSYTLTVNETDIAGNTGTTSVGFTLDTAPDVVTAKLSNDTGASSSDGITMDDSLKGTADANSAIQIYNGATLLASTTADGSGNWSVAKAALGLADGSYTLTVNETDIAGNTGTTSVGFTLDTAPDVVTAKLSNDTGASSSDGITMDDSLKGTADANSAIQIYNGATLLASTTADGSGNWSVAKAALGLADGSYTLTVNETDIAGNTGTTSVGFTLDTAPDVVTAKLSNDTGASSSDGITMDDSLKGTADANSAIQIYNGATLLASTTADGSGNWSVAKAALGLADGSYTLTVNETDIAGNTGTTSVGFTLDTAPDVVTAKLSNDTGASSSDGITMDDSLKGTADANSAIQIYNGATLLASTTADGSGNWSVAKAALGLADGSYTLTVNETDIAGNTGTTSVGFTLDTAPDVVTAKLSNDTGASSSDGITMDDSLKGTADANSAIQIYNGATLLASTTADGSGNWSVAKAALGLADGSYTLTVNETDIAGNTGTTSVGFTLDTAPDVVTAKLSNDTGASSSDGITMDDSLKGTADANSAIQIYNGATLLASTTADGSGNWSVAKAALGLADGSYTLTVNETDIAGNTGTTSVGFTLDTAPDVVTAKLSNDTGASSSDGITMDDSLKGTADANSAIQIYNGATLLASTTADGSGNWSVAKAALGLADGSYTLTVNETDIAGNTGTTSVGFTLDTAPDVVTAKLSNDTGASSSDGITMDDSLKGTADANSAIQIYNGATLLASTTADGSGNWSVAKAALGLADGSYTLTVNETDIAGNTGTTSVGFTLDTAPDVVTAKLSNDTGASSSDGITMDDSLKGTADANSAIQIYNGATLLASTTADGSGNWSVAKAALGLADGSYTLTVNETDIAGNTGTTSVGFTLDTAPDVVTAKLSNDTGASSSDGITMDDSLKGTADANSAIQIYNGATLLASTTADGSGNWSVAKAALGLADGSYTLTVNETDIAGNTGTTSVGFTLDTAPDVVTAKLSNDTGASSSDGITMDDSLKGTADANSAIQIYNGATLLASTTADGSGNWSVAKAALGLADGSYTLTVNETDIAGNTGTTSVGFTLDTAPDVVTAKLSNDTGASSSDGITMDDSLKGTADANSAIQIYNGATLLASTTADGSGNWSVAKAALGLADGSYTLTVNETDIAGNTGTTSVG